MQSKYLGDKADFSKFGLLRRLCGADFPNTKTSDLTLGIVWFLTPDECCKRDGGNVGYLCDTEKNRREFRNCDPCLWEELRSLVDHGKRCVHKVPGREILPEGTKFYDDLLYFPGRLSREQSKESKEQKKKLRAEWLANAVKEMKGAELVLLDPNIGITPDDGKPTHNKGPNYVFLEDIRQFWSTGHSLVIYQHLDHSGVAAQVRCKAGQLGEILGIELVMAVRSGSRLFFILPQKRHIGRIEERIQRMLDEEDRWGRHFEPVEVADV